MAQNHPFLTRAYAPYSYAFDAKSKVITVSHAVLETDPSSISAIMHKTAIDCINKLKVVVNVLDKHVQLLINGESYGMRQEPYDFPCEGDFDPLTGKSGDKVVEELNVRTWRANASKRILLPVVDTANGELHLEIRSISIGMSERKGPLAWVATEPNADKHPEWTEISNNRRAKRNGGSSRRGGNIDELEDEKSKM